MLKSCCSVLMKVSARAVQSMFAKGSSGSCCLWYIKQKRKAYIMTVTLRKRFINFILKLWELLDCGTVLSTRWPHRNENPIYHNHG